MRATRHLAARLCLRQRRIDPPRLPSRNNHGTGDHLSWRGGWSSEGKRPGTGRRPKVKVRSVQQRLDNPMSGRLNFSL